MPILMDFFSFSFESILFWFLLFLNWDSLHARLNSHLQGMELQEKEAQKDQSIQEVCLEKTYS